MVEPRRFEVNFVFEEGKKIVVMLGGPDGNPLPNLSYEVIIGDDTHQGTTSSEGLATESIKDENIDKITIKWDAGGSMRERVYYLEGDDFDDEEGQSHRISNMFFSRPGLKELLEDEFKQIDEYDIQDMEEYKKSIQQLIDLC